MKFNDWVNMQRGRSLAVAHRLGVSQPVVSDWVNGKKNIPAIHCRDILEFSEGAVTVQDMRPDDWFKYWPELAESKAQPAPETMKPEEGTESVTDANAMRTGAVPRITNRRIHAFGPPDQPQPATQPVAQGV